MPINKVYLKAGQTLPLVIGGEYLQYVDGSAPIELRKAGGSWSEFWIGTGTGRESFDSFEVRNPAAYDVTIFLWVDSVEFIDRRRNQIEAPTEFSPVQNVAGVYDGAQIQPNSNLDLSGAAPAGRVRRKAVQVVNLSPSINLLLQDATGRTGLVVRPGETITQPVSGFLRIRNASVGEAVACHVSELWWLP